VNQFVFSFKSPNNFGQKFNIWAIWLFCYFLAFWLFGFLAILLFGLFLLFELFGFSWHLYFEWTL